MEVCGGKGANQAVAAARLGAEVAIIGCVGDDAFAKHLLENLVREEINVSHVSRRSNCASGLAIVSVDDTGENSITVVPGANAMLSVQEAIAAADVIRSSHTLLLQLEVPVATVIAAIEIARAANTRVILDPAPAPSQFARELFGADLICPNENEAAMITGSEVDSVESAQNAARELNRLGAGKAIITLGGQGAVVSDQSSIDWIEPFPIESVDSTAAGDAFAAGARCSLGGNVQPIGSSKIRRRRRRDRGQSDRVRRRRCLPEKKSNNSYRIETNDESFCDGGRWC